MPRPTPHTDTRAPGAAGVANRYKPKASRVHAPARPAAAALTSRGRACRACAARAGPGRDAAPRGAWDRSMYDDPRTGAPEADRRSVGCPVIIIGTLRNVSLILVDDS